MKTKKDVYQNAEEETQKYISSIVKPIFDKALPQETPKNPMSVGGSVGVGRQIKKFCLYQPHNYRLYFDFKRDNLNLKPFEENKKDNDTAYRIINKIECEVRNFKDCRIVIKKNQVEVTNLIDYKKWYRIEISNKAKKQIKDIVKRKDKECNQALKDFISMWGGESDFTILNRHSEDKIRKEEIIDLLPIKQKWHIPKIAKKVYNDRNVEFADPAFASNYITNRAIEEVAPEIKDELKGLKIGLNAIVGVMSEQSKNILALTEQINVHIPAVKKLGENAEIMGQETIKLRETIEQLKPKQSFIQRRFYLLSDIWNYLKVRKKWWLLPLIIMFILLGLLIIFSQSSAISPFIYALF